METIKTIKEGMESYMRLALDESSGKKQRRVIERVDDGTTYIAERKIGRNKPCPCGAPMKYKHCCGAKDV